MNTLSALKPDCRQRKEFELSLGRHSLKLGRVTRIMGIVNLTSDSFSGDGIHRDPRRAQEAIRQMAEQGADIIDIGGESTRPGAQPVSAEEEKDRVIPVIQEAAKRIKLPISVDTSKSEVAYAALQEGASIVNDISGLKFDSRMPEVIARFGAGCVLMHIKGNPQNMQQSPVYVDLIEELIESLRESLSLAAAAGISRESIVIDPGIGFGKSTAHNLQIVNNLREFDCLDLPILIGVSRKSFIGNVLEIPVDRRLWGTAASVAVSICRGAHIVRVHDVQEMAQVARMADAILNC
jgi:dihydropteroate synthase